MNLNEASKRFLAHCQSAITLSDHTTRAYRSDLADYAGFIGPRKSLASVQPEQLRGYILHLRSERGLKESTIKRKLATLKLLVKWAMHEGRLKTNPFDALNEKIRLPRRLPRALDRDDSRRLRRAVDPVAAGTDFDKMRRSAAVQLLLETGIRVGELVSIACQDVSLSDKAIVIHGKGNRQRLVYLYKRALLRAIARYVERRLRIATPHDELFISASGTPLTTAHIRRELRAMAGSAGLARHVTPHMLRHTCATSWLESGLDIRFVQKLLGHHSISTTEIYTHVSDQGLRIALERVNQGRFR